MTMTEKTAIVRWTCVVGAGFVLASGLAATVTAAQPGDAAATTTDERSDGVDPPEVIAKSQRTPLYPAAARAARISGAVVVEATIDPEGKVREATAIVCTHPDLGFEEAAVDSVKRWKFRPALYHGEPVEYTTRFRLFFGRNAAALYGAQMSLAAMRNAPEPSEPAVRRPTYKQGDRAGKGTIPSRR